MHCISDGDGHLCLASSGLLPETALCTQKAWLIGRKSRVLEQKKHYQDRQEIDVADRSLGV